MSLTGTHAYGTNIQDFLPKTNKVCVCTHPQSLVSHTPNATLWIIHTDIYYFGTRNWHQPTDIFRKTWGTLSFCTWSRRNFCEVLHVCDGLAVWEIALLPP